MERKYKNISILAGDMSVAPIWKLNKNCYKYNPTTTTHKSMENSIENEEGKAHNRNSQFPLICKNKSVSDVSHNSTILKLINESKAASNTHTNNIHLTAELPKAAPERKVETIFHFENSKEKIKEEEKRIKSIIHRDCTSIMSNMLKFGVPPKKSIQISDKITNFSEWDKSYDKIIEQYKQNRNATRKHHY